mgnify:FL=1
MSRFRGIGGDKIIYRSEFAALERIHEKALFSVRKGLDRKSFENVLGFDGHLAVFLVEFYNAIDESEKRVVASDADVCAGMEASAALADDDVAGDYLLATELLDAKPFGIAIASVPTGSLSFFMRHCSVSLLKFRTRWSRF